MQRLLLSLFVFLNFSGFAMAQSPGTMDASFGTNGVLNIPFYAFDIFPQPDNSFFTKGFDSPQFEYYVYWKHQPNGTLDSTYGVDGKFITPASNIERIEALGNDKFALLSQETIGLPNNDKDLKISVLNANFETDSSWGLSGSARFNAGYSEFGLYPGIQPDGKLVLFGLSVPPNNLDYETSIFLCRFTAAGLIDSTFGFNGLLKPYIENSFDYRWQSPVGLIMLPDGKFLIGAQVRIMDPIDKSRFYFARYLPNGAIDQNFGSGGYIYQDIGSQTTVLKGMALDNQGRLIAFGIADYSLTVMARYLPNGQLDNTFSGDGLFTNNYMDANTMVVQPDRKILVGGNEYNINMDQLRIMRLNENGSFDNSFSSDGKVSFNFAPNAEEQIFDLELQANGKILFSGLKNQTGENYLVRLHSGLIVATEEPLSPSIKTAKACPSLVQNESEIAITFPHSGVTDPTAILVDASGRTSFLGLKDGGDGLNLSTQIPAQLSPGLYHILFVYNDGDLARASFMKL